MKPIFAGILSVSSTVLTDFEKSLLEKSNPLGVALFSRNLQTKEQVKNLTDSIKEVVGRDDVLIALDQEGGRVNRLLSCGGMRYASQELLSKTHDEKIIKAHARLICADMKEVGANFNFAPVLDLDYPDTTNALKSRSFGSDVRTVSKYGRILWQTYAHYGICPCIKHLPGHGRALSDPHLHLPVINFKLSELKPDFTPFISNKNCPSAMTAHILIPEIDPKNPITFSKKGIQNVIRSLIGYKGFLISDALEMKALKGSVSERVNASLDAGVDAVCYCFGDEKGLFDAVQTKRFLSDKSLERFEKIRAVLKTHRFQRKLDSLKENYYSVINLFDEKSVNYDATEVLFDLKKGEK